MNKAATIDWPTVLKLFGGGAMVGAGVGAGTSLAHYLQTIDEKARRQSDMSRDDDTLYIDLPPKGQPMANRRAVSAPKWASSNPNSVGTFVAGTGAGLVGTYLAYNAIRNLYNQSRKQQLQKELDAAHHLYVGNLGDTSMQKASAFSWPTVGVGSGYLALLLGALGSGVVANKMLNKFMPPLQKPFQDRPRKIVIRSDNPDEDQIEEPRGGVTPDEVEHLVRTTAANPKAASMDGGISDLIAAAAQGRCDEIRENIGLGVDFMFETIKGARHVKTSSVNENLAMTWLAVDPIVSEAIQPVLAAEFHDMSPGIFKLASHIPAMFHEDLVGIVKVSTVECRKATYAKLGKYIPAVKQAGAAAAVLGSDLLEYMLLNDSLKKTMQSNQGQDQGAPETGQTPSHINTPISKDSPDMAAYRKGQTHMEIEDDDAKQFADKYGPEIDSAVRKI